MKKTDPRQSRSKDKLHTAYITLIANESSPLTIQQVCQEANVTRPTFYKQFNDIASLRQDIHSTLLHELKQSLTINNPKPLTQLRAEERATYLTTLFEHIYDQHLTYETMLVQQVDAVFLDHVKTIIQEYVDEGITHTMYSDRLRVDRTLLVSYITGAYVESILWWIKNHYTHSPEQMAEQLIELSIFGPYILDSETGI
ncbi:transcriptional regulator, TetR family [Geomicrobium sp. JCM 19037]|uniref:TetR/AcrR family transcriptional regulator n=1 Tax=unclassified Geomicrobium TaxID=2628951 RepID=UPI00045F3A08|nr:TetR-like C-terminal domain-containing protein [Geomicrobium sp. JCM 19037]GAK04418.1 transcriptional regulator, TetR family [Geomicrobium sp. JCM 19037]